MQRDTERENFETKKCVMKFVLEKTSCEKNVGNTHSTYMLNYKFVSVPTATIFEFPFCSSIILSERVVNWSATETGSNKRERRDRERN